MVQHSDKADKSIRTKGFTLVELIVVIVILAILAAILVPALLGYIDKAKDAQYILKAKNLITAAQAEFSELYAKDTMSLKIDTTRKDQNKSSGYITSIGAYTNDSTTYNVFLYGTQLANDIWETAGISKDEQPYVCIIGLGRSTEYLKSSATAHKAYTVCWAMWWEDKDDPDTVMYWDGSEWTKKFDWGTGEYSYKPRESGEPIKVNGKDVYLQLYILKFINGHNYVTELQNSDWTDLQNLFSK